MSRVYVDNAKNRQLGRVGMPMGSMPESKGTAGSNHNNAGIGPVGRPSSGRGQAARRTPSPDAYVDNAYNRRLGRAGMPKGSMVVQKSAGHDQPGGRHAARRTPSPDTYADNASNRRLGRAGMPKGSMVVQNSASHEQPEGRQAARQTPSPDAYVDNAYNRRLGRAGMPKGSMVVQKSASHEQPEGRGSKSERDLSPDTYLDSSFNRKLGTVGMPKGSMVWSKSGGHEHYENHGDSPPPPYYSIDERHKHEGRVLTKNDYNESFLGRNEYNEGLPEIAVRPKVYVDNPQNQKLGGVGMPHGEAVIYKNSHISTTPATQTKLYKDNPLNRRLGRVGLPIGTAVFSSKTKCMMQSNYDDTSENRKLGRVGKPRGCLPFQKKKSKTTEKIPEMLEKIENGDEFREYEFEGRDTESGDLEFGMLDSHGDRVVAFDEAMYRHNRLQEELSWKRNTTSKTPPKTQVAILKDYKGKKIPFTELKLRKVIGKGGFGQVYFAKWNETVVAVKKLQNEKISEARIRDFAEEMMTFCTLNHPNIVKFIGACIEKPNLCIIMEYMQMTLYDAIYIRNDIDFNESEATDIIKQTCEGMNYLHAKRIAHCDLKTPNILLDYIEDEICEVKITDFGLSMIIHDLSVSVEELVQNIGTPQYSPPEMLRGEVLSAKDMMKADVYSLALIFLEVIFHNEPFPEYSHTQLKQEVGERGTMPEIPSQPDIDESIRDIMEKAFSYYPSERPNMSKITDVVRACENIIY